MSKKYFKTRKVYKLDKMPENLQYQVKEYFGYYQNGKPKFISHKVKYIDPESYNKYVRTYDQDYIDINKWLIENGAEDDEKVLIEF
jgi:hypothetical protein